MHIGFFRQLGMVNDRYLDMMKFFVMSLMCFCFIACSKPTKDLSSYESAKAWVVSTYAAEVMTPDSTNIYRVEFYAFSPEKWLIVYFKQNKSKGYLYQNFTAEKWNEWKSSESKGRWYHQNLKGKKQYIFNPSS